MADTADLVQEVLLKTFTSIKGFRPEHEHAFRAYLRQGLLNRVRDEFRKTRARPFRDELHENHGDATPSPLDAAVGADLLEQYEAALARLRPDERDLLVSRIELGLTYEEIAESLGRPNANAARSATVRALERLASEMNYGR
jgi:RNA polymerase sigma-70 factor (ECF subfamily)